MDRLSSRPFSFDNGGASIYRFASDDNPEIILTAAGDIATREMLRARDLIKRDLPEARLRFVGINSLTYRAIGTTTNQLAQNTFNDYFGEHTPIIASFHGYPDTLKNILAGYTYKDRISVHGFEEIGSTTTPLEMLRLSHNSRFDLATDISNRLNRPDLAEKYQNQLERNRLHAFETGTDLLKLN